MLEDCYRHYVRKSTLRRQRARYIRNVTVPPDAYDREDVHRVSELAISCDFEETITIGDAQVIFYPAGHILGAASILIRDDSGRQLLFSGDFSSFPQATVQAADWPNDLGQIDLLVLESTYGNRNHSSLNAARKDLVSFVLRTLNNDGSAILASFGLGRAQELLSLMAASIDDGVFPDDVPIYIDGMIRQINPIYAKFASLRTASTFCEISGQADRQDVARAALRQPSIIVTTSGMLTGGPVVEYARHLLPDPRNRIVLTGYQDEGAPSNALLGLTGSREVRQKRSVFRTRTVRTSSSRRRPVPRRSDCPLTRTNPAYLTMRGACNLRTYSWFMGNRIRKRPFVPNLLHTNPNTQIHCGLSEFRAP